MIPCPMCGTTESAVLRTYSEGAARCRRRCCLSCGSIFVTTETVDFVAEKGKPKAKEEVAPAPPPAPAAEAEPKRTKRPPRFEPTAETAGEVFCCMPPKIQDFLLEWWCTSRRQRNPDAAWTQLAWEQNVNRVQKVLEGQGHDAALQLAEAGAERGWQALMPEYVFKAPPPAVEEAGVSAIREMLTAAGHDG